MIAFDSSPFMPIKSSEKKAEDFSKYFNDASKDFCESTPSVIHNPDLEKDKVSPITTKKTGHFNPKKIKSLEGSLKPPKFPQPVPENWNSFLVESSDSDVSYNMTMDEAQNSSYQEKVSKSIPSAQKEWTEEIDKKHGAKFKVLSEEDIRQAKEDERMGQLSEAERDAEERFSGLT